MRKVYLDNAATTPMDVDVANKILQINTELIGNPSSTHSFGRQSKAILEQSRKSIAAQIGAHPSSIVFTSGGTEANNTVIKGSVEILGVQRIITTALEHHAVLHPIEHISKSKSIEVVTLSVNKEGEINLVELESILRASNVKTLVSLMHINNEIGTIHPLESIGRLCRENDALFHSDTVQSIGQTAFDLQNFPIDFITCSAHKIHGPKGVGFMYVNRQINFGPFIEGGAQERGLRGGTENVSGIAGLALALEKSNNNLIENQTHFSHLKEKLLNGLKEIYPKLIVNGTLAGSPKILNVTLPIEKDSSMVLFNLDIAGIAVSGGSACTSGSLKGSHVLEGIGASMQLPAIRFSFSKYTSLEDIDYTLALLKNLSLR